jgi:N-acetylglucosaminyldiphosphoundecaprenol N-acetyl-beta-D-mannosaminyltransferase
MEVGTVKSVRVIKTNIHILKYKHVLDVVLEWAMKHESRSIFFCNVHMAILSYKNSNFLKRINTGDLVCADGRPIFFLQKLLGEEDCEQIRGPETMLKLLKLFEKENLPIGLFGSSKETLFNLKKIFSKDYPNLKVAFCCSPPFGDLSSFENDGFDEEINKSGARVLFVALGCPKQEEWISSQREKINMPMLGVGAAFDYISQNRVMPKFIINLGLEWLFRLILEPKRLWRRYLSTNPIFIWLALRQLLMKKKFTDSE